MDNNTFLSRLAALFTRKKTIQPRPYVGPGIEVLLNGIPVTQISHTVGDAERTFNINCRPDPLGTVPIVSYKWVWLTPPQSGISLQFDNSAYTIMNIKKDVVAGSSELQVIGTRADGTLDKSKAITVVTLNALVGNEYA